MSDATISLDQIAAETLEVPIVGTAPLIVHRFSEKAKRQMLDATQGRKTPKEPKDPHAEYDAAFYRMKDGESFGFPAVAFKTVEQAEAKTRHPTTHGAIDERRANGFTGKISVGSITSVAEPTGELSVTLHAASDDTFGWAA